MSVICLICKDKLLNNAPGSPLGSLNSLVENQAVSTGCGHLYHFECLQSWFRTEKKKLQNQGITGNFPDHCPACQAEVRDEDIRRIYLLEDHRDSLERAVLLERLENMEIYCHQLEVHVQQLQRENDLLLNKALSPSKSRRDEFAAIVKNDKVMWLKKDSTPLSGVVSTIFKKDGSLWVKIKLDKKIRTNQRTGLFGSFRFDKNKEITVPFEEIVLEKDFKKNNIIHENEFPSEHSTPVSPIALQKMPSFRSSTLSLPGEYLSPTLPGRGSQEMQHNSSFDFIHNYGSTMELSHPIPEQPEDNDAQVSNSVKISRTSSAPTSPTRPFNFGYNGLQAPPSRSIEIPTTLPVINEGNKSSLEHRDYVFFDPSRSPKLNAKANGHIFASTPQLQDIKKPKNVTFADDLLLGRSSIVSMREGANHFRDHGYNNVMSTHTHDMNGTQAQITQPIDQSVVGVDINMVTSPIISIQLEQGVQSMKGHESNSNRNSLILTPVNFVELSTPPLPQSSSSVHSDLQPDVFLDALETLPEKYNRSCFDITFSMLFYDCHVFDKILLMRERATDDIQHSVRQILTNEFVVPLRDPMAKKYFMDYSDRLYQVISHLCSDYLDLEELMTILFEYVFKIPPFIGYAFDMCDYIHQFLIDFTDKARSPTVQQLLERSLHLQDDLKLRGEPSPALFLQMPNSKDGLIIHYEVVLPSLILNLEDMLEKDSMKGEALSCYCNKIATLECATCAKIHGKSHVRFCEECSVLLESIHDQMYHKLELVPINAINASSSTFILAGIICLKDNEYSVFLRGQTGEKGRSTWSYIEGFKDGKPKISTVSFLDEWIESLCPDSAKLDLESLDTLHRKLLTECRMFFYLPMQNSFA